MAHQERVNIAVFIDFDNIEIGVRTTLNEHFDVGTILEALKERGKVVTKIAYADWTSALRREAMMRSDRGPGLQRGKVIVLQPSGSGALGG